MLKQGWSVGVCVAALLGWATLGYGQVQERASALSFSSAGFTGEQRSVMREAYRSAYRHAVSCDYLKKNHPELHERVLQIYENESPQFQVAESSEKTPYECAYTHSGIFSSGRIYLRPAAFTECHDLSTTMFHEMLHLATSFQTSFDDIVSFTHKEEDIVTVVEHRCFPEYFAYNER